MPNLTPEDDPQAYPTSLPVRPAGLNPHADPVVHARRPILTIGNCILAVIIITFGLYATGNLPQFDHFFDSLHTRLQGRNDAVVGAVLHFGPLLLLGFVVVIFVVFAMLRIFVRPTPVSDNMEWHATASAAPRPVVAVHANSHTEASFIKPLHKQSKIRESVVAPEPAITTETKVKSSE